MLPRNRYAIPRPFTAPAIAAIFSILSLVLVPSACAQAPAPSPSLQKTVPGGASNLSDQKITAAATAMQRVAMLRQNYEQQLAKAPQEQQQRIAGEANAAMQKAVTDQGLSLEEYNGIVTAARNDPALRDQLVQRMQPSQPSAPQPTAPQPSGR